MVIEIEVQEPASLLPSPGKYIDAEGRGSSQQFCFTFLLRYNSHGIKFTFFFNLVFFFFFATPHGIQGLKFPDQGSNSCPCDRSVDS